MTRTVFIAGCLANSVLVLALSWPCVALGREFDVRLLEGNEKRGVWGTSEFQVTVTDLGVVRHVICHGQEVLWQAAALYTSPVPPGESEGVRTVQGEGFGKRGLTVEPPVMSTRDENGTRIFEFRHRIANLKVLDGAPLCDVTQRIAIAPQGEIAVRYEFAWRQTLRWRGFSLLFLFNKDACREREYMVVAGPKVWAGTLVPGPVTEQRLRSVHIEQLTVRAEIGPCHLVWPIPGNCAFSWAEDIQLTVRPASTPHSGFIYQGHEGALSYRILLPVSQQ